VSADFRIEVRGVQRARRDRGTEDRGSPKRLPVRRWPERRVVVLAVAVLLLTGAFAASILSETALDELAVLYTVPVILAGLELGLAGGVAGAVLALLLLLAASGRHSELEAFGLAACGSVFLLAGALAGRFSARMHASQRRQQGLYDSGLRLARLETLEALPMLLVDELRRTLEVSCVRVQLEDAPAVEVGVHAGEQLVVPIEARGISFGSLTLSAPNRHGFAPEDEVVASQLALQAAVAADNQRLLASERERAALHVELEQTRERFASHLRDVTQILDSEEAERSKAARQLHEGFAQDMAALLLVLQSLAKDLDRELSRKQLAEVRGIASDTLVGLRQLALDLRPSSLDERGLHAALQGIVEREQVTSARQIGLDYECPCDLAPEVETSVFRLVDDAIRTSTGALTVQLKTTNGGDSLRIKICGGSTDGELLGKLAGARARIVLIGGTLQSSFNGTTTIVAELPCASQRAPAAR
jgi:signal transduction histidine kinase